MFGKALEVIQFQICIRRTIDKLGHEVGWVEKNCKAQGRPSSTQKARDKTFSFHV